MYKNILIPTDGSALSRAAALKGIELAKALGARVTAFFAAPAPTPVLYKGLVPVGFAQPKVHAAMIEKAAARYLGVIVKAAKGAGVKCKAIHVTDEYPAEAILKVAAKERCDLIVIASHGRSGLSRAVMGSQTQKVIDKAKIPVLVQR